MFSPCKRSSDGLLSYCKACYAQISAAYRAKDPEKAKAITAKSNALRANKVAATKRRYREENAQKVRDARKAAYAKNKDTELERSRKYKAENKEAISEKARKWLASNGALNRFYRSERRAIEKQARPSWYDREKAKELYYLASLKSEETGAEWHVDHIVPLKSTLVCGLHWHGNMQIITAAQNQSKSNRHWPDMP